MKNYNSYKDTDLDWLKKIPNKWNLLRSKDVVSINNKSLSNNTSPHYEFKYVDISNVNQNGIVEEPELMKFAEAPSRARRRVSINDVIVSTVRTYLKAVAYINFEPSNIIVSTGFAVLSPSNKINSAYLAFYCQSDFFIDLVIKNSKGVSYPAINSSEVANLTAVYPPINEQVVIGKYLENTTNSIDQKVALLEKEIFFYQELRKSLINDIVTKGLDKNCELHSNELGFKTPKKWLKYRLKDLGFLFSGLSGKSGDEFNQDDNLYNKNFIPFTNISSNTYLKQDHLGKVVVYENEKQNKVRKGDIFFLMSSESYEDIGKTAALAVDIDETYLNSFCKGFRINPRKCNPFFLNYLMLSDYYRQLLIVEGRGFTRINLKMEKVNDFLVYVPNSLNEQEQIVKILDAKLDNIAKITNNIKSQIITFKEMRKTLINDVVTGKIKVLNN